MKNLKLFTVFIFLLSALFISSCDVVQSGGDYKSFHSDLLGTWETNAPGLYLGSLKIDYNTITIDGYGEEWLTLLVGDDSKRPFKEFPKRVPLKGYSEEGKIFIEYGGSAQGVLYIYEPGANPPNSKTMKFTFGGREEILQWTADS